MPVTLDEQVACVKREIGMRQRVYPKWVTSGRMTQAKADAELAAMRAVLNTLERLKAIVDGLNSEMAGAVGRATP